MKTMFPNIAVERAGPVTYRSMMGKKPEDENQETNFSVKPKVVMFFKNGDRHFHGVQVSITPRRFRNFENLLNELTRITKLPHGVRYVFTPSDGSRIEDLQQLENGKSYVCASFRKFKRIDYGRTNGFGSESRLVGDKGRFAVHFNRLERPSDSDAQRFSRVNAIKPRIITVIRNGYTKPRKAVKVLLNRKTAQTYDQVLDDITSAVGVEGSSGIRKLYTTEGILVHDLSHLLNNGEIFIAVGNEKFNPAEAKSLLQQINQAPSQAIKPQPHAPKKKEKYDPQRQHGEGKDSTGSKENIFPDKAENTEKLQINDSPTKSKKQTERGAPSKNRKHSEETEHLPVLTSPSHVLQNSNPPANNNNISSKTEPGSSQDDPSQGKSPRDILPAIAGNKTKSNDLKQSNSKVSQPKRKISNGSVRDYYDIGKKLGDGNFAIVREITDKDTSQTYALKIIDCAKIKGKENMIKNEIEIMRSCNHLNIVNLIEDFHTSTEIYLVLELVEGGDLFDLISTSIKFPEKEAAEYLVDICKALNYLHKRNIVHRDLKPENLLVHVSQDGKKSLKLADFGLAMEVLEPIYTVCGTPTYVAPEILNESGYGLEVDMWAAGVIGYIMLCGFPPFRSVKRRQSELFDLIEAGEFEFLSPYWDEVSAGAKDLISCLLVVDRRGRYTAEKTLNHAWIKDSGSDRSLSDLPSIDIPVRRKRFKAAALTVQSTQRLKMLASNLNRGEKVLTHVDPKR